MTTTPTREQVEKWFEKAGVMTQWKPGYGNQLILSYLQHFAALVRADQLAELSKDAEPVAHLHCTDEGYVYARIVEGGLSRNGLDLTTPHPLYHHPQPVAAIEHRVVEACALWIDGYAGIHQREMLSDTAKSFSDALRRGEWRRFVNNDSAGKEAKW